MITKEKLKLYFEEGDKPTQEQFWEWMDSYWHKEEKISAEALPEMIDTSGLATVVYVDEKIGEDEGGIWNFPV
ncbi:hypothetical protein GCM10023210_21950 [Chryseobacterium ginsengisoli]|uniref:Uncharacterized protein n=1 Tax=Chryseobacterium ginsengisoli TaxID=363853 RepID=A0ABP9MD67_9FLAO